MWKSLITRTFDCTPPPSVSDWARDTHWSRAKSRVSCAAAMDGQFVGLQQRLAHCVVPSGTRPGASWPVGKGQTPWSPYHRHTHTISLVIKEKICLLYNLQN